MAIRGNCHLVSGSTSAIHDSFDISMTSSEKQLTTGIFLKLFQNLVLNLVRKDVDELIIDVGKCVSDISG